jgi:hypothetical protein
MNKMIKYLLNYFIERKKELILKKKIAKIYNNCFNMNKPDLNLIESQAIHKNTWKELGFKVNNKWFLVYAEISSITDPAFVPENIYYNFIEPRLNDKNFSRSWTDKNFYELILDKDIIPRTFLRNINGVYYDVEYNPLKISPNNVFDIMKKIEGFIIKPSVDSGGGRSVEYFIKKNEDYVSITDPSKIFSIAYVEKIFKNNFIIQEYIVQHEFFKQFNSSSLNTVRIFTYRDVKTEQIYPLQAVLRIGRAGSVVDNQASGGIACGIKPDGCLNDFGIDKYGSVYKEFNSVVFKDVGKIMNFEKIVDLAIKIAKKYYYSRLLGLDFCLDQYSEIKLLEVNDRNNEVNFYQMNNGPLFSHHLNDIIKYCINQPKSLSISEYL